MKVVAVNLLVLFGLLAIVEAALRIMGEGAGNAILDGDPVLRYVHPAGYSYRCYTPSNEYGGHLVTYDADGFRINEAQPPIPNLPQLWFVGDSFTVGMGVRPEEGYVDLLQRALSQASAGRKFVLRKMLEVVKRADVRRAEGQILGRHAHDAEGRHRALVQGKMCSNAIKKHHKKNAIRKDEHSFNPVSF